MSLALTRVEGPARFASGKGDPVPVRTTSITARYFLQIKSEKQVKVDRLQHRLPPFFIGN